MVQQGKNAVPVIPGYDPLSEPLSPVADEFDIARIVERTTEMLSVLYQVSGSRFPWGSKSAIAYEGELEGRAFLITARTQEAEIDDNFNKGQKKLIVRTLIRLFNPETGELMPDREARFQGGYVVNQLRGMTERDLVGSYLWTLARDETKTPYQRGDGWEYPRMLAVYDSANDSPADAKYDLSWSEGVEEMARKVAVMAEQGTTILPTRSRK